MQELVQLLLNLVFWYVLVPCVAIGCCWIRDWWSGGVQ